MTRSISTSDAKAKLSGYLDWVDKQQDEVIIESHGKPKAVLISYASYAQFRVWQEQRQRQAALDELQALADSIHTRNRDLTAETAHNLADRLVRDVVDEMVAEGKIQYDAGDA